LQLLFVIPGSLDTPTGGYRYDRLIVENLISIGLDVKVLSLDGNFPFPSNAKKAAALKQIQQTNGHDIAVVDGLAGGAHPDMLDALSQKSAVIALVHHPLCLENGLDPSDAHSLEVSEKEGLQHCACVITTSPATSDTVNKRFGYDAKKIRCVLPGVDRGKQAQAQTGKTTHLLCVGSVIERKGHHYLVNALAKLKGLDWKLDCVGMNTLDPELFETITASLVNNGLSGRIRFHGAVEEETLERFYQLAHCFVLPSLYEGYGMAYAEAIVRGLPVIGTTAGAIPDTVPPNCGLLIEPENTKELENALRTIISDASVRENLRLASLDAADTFPTWQRSAESFVDILKEHQ